MSVSHIMFALCLHMIWTSSILQELLLCPLSVFFFGKMLSSKMLSSQRAFSKRAFCQGKKCSLYFISVLFYVTGSEFLVVTSTDAFYFRNHVSEMFPSKECHTCKKCQQGFKSLPTQMNHVWSQHCILLSDSTTPLKEKVPH